MAQYNNCHYWRGQIYKEWWTTDGVIYKNDEEPSIIEYDDDGTIDKKIWYNKDGQIHRKDAPAVIYYGYKGKIELEEYYHNGKFICYGYRKNLYEFKD